MASSISTPSILLRGAGDIASGVALRLYRAGFTKLIFWERNAPLAVRRNVSFCEAVRSGTCRVEGIEAQCLMSLDSYSSLSYNEGLALCTQVESAWAASRIPVIVDEVGISLAALAPHVFIEATLRKVRTDLHPGMADLVLALGPGHSAPEHAHAIIETQRGHSLGRVIRKGEALPNTGIPGPVGGLTLERLLRAPVPGVFRTLHHLGDSVRKGEVVGWIEGPDSKENFLSENTQIRAGTTGIIRGLLYDGATVSPGLKLGDVDPRPHVDWHTVSEKALAVGGGVLEAVCAWWNKRSGSTGFYSG